MKSRRHKAEQQKGVADVSLKRPDGWYSADNEMVTVFAPLIGVWAFSVYHLLKQRAFLKEEDERGISYQGLADEFGISKDSAGNAIATLKKFYLVDEIPSAVMNKPPRYEVEHAKDVLGTHPEFRTWVEELRREKQETRILKTGRKGGGGKNPHIPQSHPENRTRVKTVRILKTGRVVGEIQDTDVLKTGYDRPEFRTPNKEEVLKDRRQEQDIPTQPSLLEGGKNSIEEHNNAKTDRAQAVHQDETAAAGGGPDGGADDSGGAGHPPEVVDPDVRGDKHRGGPPAVSNGGSCDRDGALNEAEDLTARRKRALAALSNPGMSSVGEMLGGLAADLRAELPEEPSTQGVERNRDPREMGTWFLQYLHDLFPIGFGSGMARTKGSNWEDPYAAWTRCFAHVSVGEVEMYEDNWVVVLETPRPKDLASGLEKYKAKVQQAMVKAFGREVQIVPRLEAA